MAGSYRHCLGDDGSFGFDLIENLGDAHEACEEMFLMIFFLSQHGNIPIHEAERWAQSVLREGDSFDRSRMSARMLELSQDPLDPELVPIL